MYEVITIDHPPVTALNLKTPQLHSVSPSFSGFDVASKGEIEMLRRVGVPTSSLLFANPCKMPGHIKHAAETGVNLTTFDCEGELHKLKQLHPGTRVLLRIRADDPEAQCPLGVKYGAMVEDVPQLLRTAKALGIHVAGERVEN